MELLIRRFAIVFFEDHVTIKIFLTACLFFLAVYLFFLHSKITFWKTWLSRKFPNTRKSIFLRKTIFGKKSLLAQSSILTQSKIEPMSDTAESLEQNDSENKLIHVESKMEIEKEENSRRNEIIDRILHRNRVIEKKLHLLQILWGILVVLTAIFIFTY